MNEPTRFSGSGDEEQIGAYKRVNFMAIFALILGFVSAVATISPFLWIVPILALFVAIPALAISKRDDMGGGVPAWLAIALALFFISFSVSEYCFNRSVLYAEAYSIAEGWLELVVAGEDRIAHQGMMSVTARQGSGKSVDEYYELDKEASAELEKRFSVKPTSDLLGLGTDSKIELMKNVTIQFDHAVGIGMVVQLYRVTAPNKEPVEAKVILTRKFQTSSDRATWVVADLEENDEPDANLFERFSAFVTRFAHSTES